MSKLQALGEIVYNRLHCLLAIEDLSIGEIVVMNICTQNSQEVFKIHRYTLDSSSTDNDSQLRPQQQVPLSHLSPPRLSL